jgi:LPPG:FO 2-phospho-L-lactate transferase
MILGLAGGVGGAKLAHGLARVLAPGQLTIAVNTADDFRHLGLHVSPDLDSVMYKLADLNDLERGWGLRDESWQFMEMLARLGGEDWFNLGDRDLATHMMRTQRLQAGESLTQVTAGLCRSLGIEHIIAPMSDDLVGTLVETEDGVLPFQHWFVRLRCEPVVRSIRFEGVKFAKPSPPVAAALQSDVLEAIILCPSNPFVSIDPIAAIPAIGAALLGRIVPLVAISPIIGGAAVKGPAAKMMAEMGLPVSPLGIARYYGNRIDGLVIDIEDAALAADIEREGVKVTVTRTLMQSAADEARLAEETLAFAQALARGGT